MQSPAVIVNAGSAMMTSVAARVSPETTLAAMTRAQFLRLVTGAAVLAVAGQVGDRPTTAAMLTRPIPSSGEALPVIGLGTWRAFDVAHGSAPYRELRGVIQALLAAGGTVIDSSPMYGRAEAVLGSLLTEAGSHGDAFVATKVWTRGRADGLRQMNESLDKLHSGSIDLMQVHNLLDWRTHLPTLREWRAAGRIRYLGISHYTASAYDELEAVMRAERCDFVQVNYSLDERAAERRILPFAAERGMAVLINRPFGGGGLLRRLRDRPLPPWADEIGATSWAQLLLKFVLSQPAVSCAIPGTGNPRHMADNAAAGFGPIPEAAFWRRHPEVFDL